MGKRHLGLDSHYGIGGEIDLEQAGSYYESSEPQRKSAKTSDTFRCLRAAMKAPSRHQRRLAPVSDRLAVLKHYESVRPWIPPPSSSTLLVSPIGTRANPEIGRGGSGRVTLAIDPKTGKRYAVKHIWQSHEKAVFIREVQALAALNHPCVLKILGWALPDKSTRSQIHTEYATNGSLDQILSEVKRGERRKFANPTGMGIIICGIVLGMRYVHWSGVVHRDLKPSNILLNEHGQPLISDFGSSRFQSDDATPTPDTGSVHYAAPELYEDEIQLTAKCDVFSFGLILYEILSGTPVFDATELPFPIIRRLRMRDLPKVPISWYPVMRELIPQCWRPNPNDRPSFWEIFARFRAHDFELLADSEPEKVRDFCGGVLDWERKAGMPQ
jgi:serine/threonine protein kinase